MNSIKTALLRNQGWVLAITLLYIILNIVLFANEWYYLSLLPFVLLVIYLAIFSLDKLILLVVFFVPISIPLDLFAPDLSFDLQLPTEPILA